MKTGLLTSASFFGKYLPNERLTQTCNEKLSTINLKQNFTHERPFHACKFDIPASRLYLLDTSGSIVSLNLNDNSFSTLKGQKIQNFAIDGNNSFNLLYVTPASELFQVGFDNKKPIKITNLNMNKLIAFERNYLREILLCLDYKVLFLCNITKAEQFKIKSLKAKGDEVFSNACFASNNRHVILVVKNSIIRVVEIMDLKTVHETKLPFPVQNIKIQMSYDSKTIAIYGDCNIVFFINIHDNETYTYELLEVPFVKAITQLKYTPENHIVFLGSDQVLYGVSAQNIQKAVPLFNEEFKVKIMSFDISLDSKKIALVSNRTVLQLKLSKGLQAQIESSQNFKQLQHRTNGFENPKNCNQTIPEVSQQHIDEPSNKQIQYEDEDDSSEQEPSSAIKTDGLAHSNLPHPKFHEQCGKLHEHVSQILGVTSEIKVQVNSVFLRILDIYPGVKNSEAIVRGILKLIKDYKLPADKCFTVMEFVVGSLQKQKEKLRHYGLIICPELVAIIETKFHTDFIDFCEQQIYNLFTNYLADSQWRDAINWLLSPGVNQKPENLPIFLISLLEHILQHLQSTPSAPHTLLLNCTSYITITFSEVYNQLIKIYLDDRLKNLFAGSKRKVVELVQEAKESERGGQRARDDGRLEQLIIRQDEIKRELADMRRNRGS